MNGKPLPAARFRIGLGHHLLSQMQTNLGRNVTAYLQLAQTPVKRQGRKA
jgi:hypothetical protein